MFYHILTVMTIGDNKSWAWINSAVHIWMSLGTRSKPKIRPNLSDDPRDLSSRERSERSTFSPNYMARRSSLRIKITAATQILWEVIFSAEFQVRWEINFHRVLYFKLKGGGPRVVVSTAAFHARVRGSVPGLGGLKETKLFLPHPRVKVSIVGSLRDREVACSASDRQGSNFESCVWRTVSSHHPREVLLAQFSLYVHKGGLKPDSFHLFQVKVG